MGQAALNLCHPHPQASGLRVVVEGGTHKRVTKQSYPVKRSLGWGSDALSVSRFSRAWVSAGDCFLDSLLLGLNFVTSIGLMAAPLAESESLVSEAPGSRGRAAGWKSRVAVGSGVSSSELAGRLSVNHRPSLSLPVACIRCFLSKPQTAGSHCWSPGEAKGFSLYRRFITAPASEGHTGGPDAVVFTLVTVVRAAVGWLRRGGGRWHIGRP